MVICATCIYHRKTFLDKKGTLRAYCGRPEYEKAPNKHSTNDVVFMNQHTCSRHSPYITEAAAFLEYSSRIKNSIGIDPMG